LIHIYVLKKAASALHFGLLTVCETAMSDNATQQAVAQLNQHYDVIRQRTLNQLFADADSAARQRHFMVSAADWTLDFSKNHLTEQTLGLLTHWATTCGLRQSMQAMQSGAKINLTEQRAVGHIALRMGASDQFVVDGLDQLPAVIQVRARCYAFANAVRSGQWRGWSGQAVTDVVNIGIGGSDLGPQMVTLALREFAHPSIRLHFVSNVDGHDIAETLQGLDPATTLFIIASKTFTTQETMANAQAARAWFTAQGGGDVAKHFVAVSTNEAAVTAFGIDKANMFGFWDWVGGRYSVWSAIGLSVMIAIGPDHFDQFLRGAHQMDQHFFSAPFEHNLPVIMALIDCWYRRWWSVSSRCIAPYHHRLRRFAAYLQQLDMESLGKSVQRDGSPVESGTGLAVWGEPGTNGQHAFFQLIHQGSDVIPVDFIAAAQADHTLADQHTKLLANCLAQSRALMVGRDLAASGSAPKVFSGNRPSNTLITQRLTPFSLGALIAAYEHKVFTCSVVWNINAFDQWGVELGKQLAGETEALLVGKNTVQMDVSTQALARQLRQWR
jgi:glucose-6-phosphate isomerase